MVRGWLIGSGAKPAQRRSFFERNGMAESANILTKLQDLLVYLIAQLNIKGSVPESSNQG